jgi:hypothetical protein
MRAAYLIAFIGAALLCACGGGVGADQPTSSPGCGSPPPTTHPQLWLVYPMPNATSIPDNVGSAIFADIAGLQPQDSVTISSPMGQVPVGAFTSAPSPLPSPRVTPGNEFGANAPYVAVPLPTLSPATTYTVNYTYQDWADNPPSCTMMNTQTLGAFTTQ